MAAKEPERSDDEAIGENGGATESSITMEGFMMKKKQPSNASSRSFLRRSIGLKWVRRYFILYQDGGLVYYRERPTLGGETTTKPDGIICANIGECQIDRFGASDLAGKEDAAVANSFYIISPRGHAPRGSSTLLVTQGPEDHKKWIVSFRKMKASILDDAEGSQRFAAKTAKSAAEVEKVQTKQRIEKELAEQEQKQKEVEYAENTARLLEAERLERERLLLAAEQQAELERLEKDRIEQERLLAEESARLEAEESARLEAEESARLEAEESARLEAEESVRLEAEESAGLEAEESARLEDEESAGLEAEESAGLEAEESAGLEAETLQQERLAAKQADIQRLENERIEQARLLAEQQRKEADEETRLEQEMESASIDKYELGAMREPSTKGDDSEGVKTKSDNEDAGEVASDKKEEQMKSEIQAGDVTEGDGEEATSNGGGLSDRKANARQRMNLKLKARKERIEQERLLAEQQHKQEDEEGLEAEEKESASIEQYELGAMREPSTKGDDSEGVKTKSDNENAGEVASDKKEEKMKSESQAGDVTQNDAKESTQGDGEEATSNGKGLAKNESEIKGEDESPSIENEEKEEIRSDKGEVSDMVLKAGTMKESGEEELTESSVPKEKTKDETNMGVKVFAFGDTFDELKKALDSGKVFFGIFATSLEEMMSDEISVPTSIQCQENDMVAFALEYGGNADENKFKDHLNEAGAFCKKHSFFDKFHPVVYNAENVKDQILKRLGAPEIKEDGKTVSPPTSKKKENTSIFENKDISIYSTTGMTAFKHALEVVGTVPSGIEILKIVRQPLGSPYNWVLFEPSKSGLIAKDAGSGGVMELTTVLQECYNDCVLFGLLRLSFVGAQFGRRQFWCGFEWKGEDCFSVKMMRQFRECHDPMLKMIGDRSFTLSNIPASEMTPEMVVERLKRSCNTADFDATVEAMKDAQDEEHKAIKLYWEKMEEKRREVERAHAEVKKRNEEKQVQLKLRQEKLSVTEGLRESRKAKWAKMSATKLLEELGKDNISGWVLLEMKVQEST